MKRVAGIALVFAALLAVGGCKSTAKHKYTSLRVYLQTPSMLPESQRATVVLTNPPLSVVVKRLPELTEIDLNKAEAAKSGTRNQLVLNFDRRGQWIIQNFTTERRGELYILTLNHVAVAAPVIRETITDGKLVVDLDLTDEEVKKLAEGLNRASLKARSR
jgi:preprotein translocase subunit SecD